MKKVVVFLLSLTSLAAHAQYNKSRAPESSDKLSDHIGPISYYGSLKPDPIFTKRFDLNLPMFLNTVHSTDSDQPLYTTSSNSVWSSPGQPGQGYWSGSKMTTSSSNGRFIAIQSFDIQGNLRESKATYQFPKRKR